MHVTSWMESQESTWVIGAFFQFPGSQWLCITLSEVIAKAILGAFLSTKHLLLASSTKT